jgi:hypothetical protein
MGEADNVPGYDDEWLVDEQSQANPYIDCRRCHTWRPSGVRWEPYNVCEYRRFNIAEGDPSRLRWCMGSNHAALKAGFFEDGEDMNTWSRCRGGG